MRTQACYGRTSRRNIEEGFLDSLAAEHRSSSFPEACLSSPSTAQAARRTGPTRCRPSQPLPDARKGEKLVLVTQKSGAKRSDFQAFAKSKGAAELMTPAEIHVVDKVPVLGSGKLDYLGVTKLVRDALAQSVAEVE
jgi:acyl-[acyl-carrier-protein]-phospholipid O-acyltransferase/long-chain-fatty-acid--[acyl-carrier-protein] ligase